MNRIGMRYLAALAAAVLLAGAPGPALADSHEFAPSRHVEDGAKTDGADDAVAVTSEAKEKDARGKDAQGKDAAGDAPVKVTSPSAVLMEARSGAVLFTRNAHERRNPASVTKVMTLIVAFDAIRDGKVKREDKVTISEEAAKQIGTIIFADTGETFTFGELLKSVAVGSANDAAVSVAEHVSGSTDAFVQAMNAKAKELGMHDTQFQNPTGLSAESHFTSAYDIALMSRYAALNYPELMKLTSIYGADLAVPWRKNGPTFRLWNNNKLLTWYRGADGLKTGWTEAAGYCLAATAVQNNVRMISVIMGADTWKVRNAEAARLLDYGFANYTSVELANRESQVSMLPVARGKIAKVKIVPQALFGVSVRKGEQGKVKTEVRLPKRIDAPVQAGQVVGEMVAIMDGKEIAKVKLVTAAEVQKANLWDSIVRSFKSVFSID
ncbi:MAG TPA: D-alanyl-D-alanine carboxypeptidase family protein [Symbiobacteriaceae bacterium]|nr:D-alanyl-D-alanine carboxypeptidase family protein [Symbiobacteriaceae bacterium]